jgi:putative ABC transport system permease protein
MKERKEETLLNFLTIDYDFLPAMNVHFVDGRNFSKDFPTDSLGIILSETAVKDMAIQGSAIGKQIVWGEQDTVINYATVVGVVKDFHFSSFHEPIKPFGFVLDNDRDSRINTYFIKVNKSDPDETLTSIQTTWKKLVPDQPLEYSFQDEQVNKLHRAETKFRSLFSYLTIVAIVIACLGLFGLSVFTAEQRTKEIGIRKVLGASVNGLIQLLSKDFLKLVFLAIIIGSPLAWFFMSRWLQDFVYRINISWLVFMYAGIAAMLIALLTVSFQAIKTAISNPVKSLRTE